MENTLQTRKPEWLKVRAPGGEKFTQIRHRLRELKLFTVCEEARCPNMGECWSGGTATIMLLGEVCTRGCKFCAVKTGRPGGIIDENEPENCSSVVAESGLEYVVLTSVDRDDLQDGGSGHFAKTVELIKQKAPHVLVECLVSDYRGDIAAVEKVVRSGLDVYAHNVETVRSLQRKVRDPRAGYDQSLKTLREAKRIAGELFASGELKNAMYTKTSIQVGHGETEAEVLETLRDLRANNVDVVTFGQYLQPSKKHLDVVEYVSPLAFRKYEEAANKMGFAYVASGPLVRSSYKAGEYFITNMIKKDRKETATHGN